MAKKKVSRKELLKGPDEFITFSGKSLDYAKSHSKQLKIAGLGIAVILILYFGTNFWIDALNKAAQNDYGAAVRVLQGSDSGPDRDAQALQKADDLFSEIIANDSMAKVSRFALVQMAHLKYLEKNYSDAVTFYQDFLDKVSGDPLYESLTKQALAGCNEEKGDFKQAIEVLTPLAKASSESAVNSSVLWDLARLYRLDGNPEKSKEILKQFVEKHKDSSLYDMAQSKL